MIRDEINDPRIVELDHGMLLAVGLLSVADHVFTVVRADFDHLAACSVVGKSFPSAGILPRASPWNTLRKMRSTFRLTKLFNGKPTECIAPS